MILSGVVLVSLCACVDAVELDRSRYIGLDEVRTDMEAYCLTVLKGNEIEKFPMKIMSIVRNFEPKRDAILVVGTDARFIHAGVIHGCSGSPVYIDGRLAGALAAGWDGSKDPFYLVTPIAEMLRIGTAGGRRGAAAHQAGRRPPCRSALQGRRGRSGCCRKPGQRRTRSLRKSPHPGPGK